MTQREALRLRSAPGISSLIRQAPVRRTPAYARILRFPQRRCEVWLPAQNASTFGREAPNQPKGCSIYRYENQGM